MKGNLWLILAWLACGAGLYFHVAVLELYWNTINWTPRYDPPSFFCFGGIAGALVGLWFLARHTHSFWVRAAAAVWCSVLLGLGIYFSPAEPVKAEGLLGRVASSPAWFRYGRLAALGAPLVFWVAFCKRPEVGTRHGSR